MIDMHSHVMLQVKDATTVVEENILQVPNMVVLPRCLMAYSPAIELLKILRFDFEPRGLTQKMCEPAVHFPSWDPDGLLRRVSSALQSLLGLYSLLSVLTQEIKFIVSEKCPICGSFIVNFLTFNLLFLYTCNLLIFYYLIVIRFIYKYSYVTLYFAT